MKICWDNLEGLHLTKKGNFRKNKTTFIYIDSCKACGNPYLARFHKGEYCDDICSNKDKNVKHGYFGKPTYRSWQSMKQRCLNKDSKDYREYGAKGITICERWMEFINFLEDMGKRPIGMTLDRIDNNGNYEPGNCRWATNEQQNRNRNFLDKNKVRKIKELLKSGKYKQKQIAEMFNVTRENISHIKRNKIWGNVK